MLSNVHQSCGQNRTLHFNFQHQFSRACKVTSYVEPNYWRNELNNIPKTTIQKEVKESWMQFLKSIWLRIFQVVSQSCGASKHPTKNEQNECVVVVVFM